MATRTPTKTDLTPEQLDQLARLRIMRWAQNQYIMGLRMKQFVRYRDRVGFMTVALVNGTAHEMLLEWKWRPGL